MAKQSNSNRSWQQEAKKEGEEGSAVCLYDSVSNAYSRLE